MYKSGWSLSPSSHANRFLHQLGRTVGIMTSDVSDFLSCVLKKNKILWLDVVSPWSVSVSGVVLLQR